MAQTDDLNSFSQSIALQTTDVLNTVRNQVSRAHGPDTGLTVAVDAALVAAVAVLNTAIHAGAIEPCDVAETVRTRLDHVLTLPNRLHERQPDGSLDPVGQRMN